MFQSMTTNNLRTRRDDLIEALAHDVLTPAEREAIRAELKSVCDCIDALNAPHTPWPPHHEVRQHG